MYLEPPVNIGIFSLIKEGRLYGISAMFIPIHLNTTHDIGIRSEGNRSLRGKVRKKITNCEITNNMGITEGSS